MTTALDILAVLVLVASLWRIASYVRWQRLQCPTCGLTMRFRCISRAEKARLQQHMQQHIDAHYPAGVTE